MSIVLRESFVSRAIENFHLIIKTIFIIKNYLVQDCIDSQRADDFMNDIAVSLDTFNLFLDRILNRCKYFFYVLFLRAKIIVNDAAKV